MTNDPGAVASIVNDIRLKLRGLIERISTELPPHISLHNTKQALEDAQLAISNHPTQRRLQERSYPNLDEQSDEVNLRKAGHASDNSVVYGGPGSNGPTPNPPDPTQGENGPRSDGPARPSSWPSHKPYG